MKMVITDNEIIGVQKRTSTKKKKSKNTKGTKIDSFLDLNVGDYVVEVIINTVNLSSGTYSNCK